MSNENIIIGISGKKRVGKNTFADYLQGIFETDPCYKDHTVIVRGFADAVREECAEILDQQTERYSSTYSHYLPILHAENQKEFYRPFLQWWSDFRMKEDCEDYWIDQMKYFIQPYKKYVLIIPDIRYPNTADWIKDNSGYVIRVDRVTQVDVWNKFFGGGQHHTESDMDSYDKWDWTVLNNDSFDYLKNQAQAIQEHIANRRNTI